MPKEIVRIAWACELCGEEFDSRTRATECENRGYAIPEYKALDLVNLRVDKKIFIAQVTGYGPDVGLPNPHLLPAYYDVNVRYRDYEPHKCKPYDKSRDALIGIRANIRDMHLYKCLGTECPMCGSRLIGEHVELIYIPYDLNMGWLPGVCMSVCLRRSCSFKFFSAEQNSVANKKIGAHLEDKKIADITKLKQRKRYDRR